MRAFFNLATTTRRSRGGVEEGLQDMGPGGPFKALLRSAALLLLLLLSFAIQNSNPVSCSKNPCSFRRRHGEEPPPRCWLRAAHGGPLVRLGFQGCNFRGLHSSLLGVPAVGSQGQRVRCLGGDSPSAREASADVAESLRGVHFYVSPTMAAPDVWGDMPRVLRGPVAYEATAVQRLRAAGASLHFLVPRGNISSSISNGSSKHGSKGKSDASWSPIVHLAVSPTFPLHVDANASYTAAASSSSSIGMSAEGRAQAPANANEETSKKERRILSHKLAFCPSRGSVSCFGCFAAATALLEEGPSSCSIAAPSGGPSSPLMDASWGPPALWLCGTEASLLRRSFRVLKGADPRDLRTVHFQQQQEQLKRQSQQQQQQEKPKIRFALLSIGDRQAASLPGSPEQHQMSKHLQHLHQHQQKQRCFLQLLQAGDLRVCRLKADTLHRAVVGGSLLQCCELAGLLLRIGDGGPTKGPPKLPAGGRRQLQHQQAQLQQEQQQHQELQQQSYWDRVFCERTEAFSSALKRRLLLGGALLKDPRKAVLVQKARAAQDALRLQLETFLEGADALLHVAEEPLSFASMGLLERSSDAGGQPHLDSQGEAANSTATFRTRDSKEQQSFICFKQLVAAVAAAGHPCIASVDGWVVLGSPGNDELLLDIAAALCSKQHSIWSLGLRAKLRGFPTSAPSCEKLAVE
ncbi:hypothetical protein Emag_006977 [Eimeria magna]